MSEGFVIEGRHEGADQVLVPAVVDLIADLHGRFEPRRKDVLESRTLRQAEFDAGRLPDFLPETAAVRTGDWVVAPTPADLEFRRVEITGPVTRKLMINALNSGADVFMADFEDSLTPTWENVIEGQLNLKGAVRRSLTFVDEGSGRSYQLGDDLATLIVRPRGWHLVDKHASVDGEPVSGGILDASLYVFHNSGELLEQGSGPYLYLPKLEGHLEARLWNDILAAIEDYLGLTRGTIKVTVLIETILAAFEMDEILYELRDRAVGLNAGRWDYIFSLIKKLRRHPDRVLPDRSQVTMAVPFMRSYADLLIKTCHRRGCHAIGGMAAYIPNRRDEQANEFALQKVREDKQREARQGFDGTWVAHPDLVPVARAEFDAVVGHAPHQKEIRRGDVDVRADDLLNTDIASGEITEAGFRNNVSVALQYLNSWLCGVGAAAIYNLMEDAATAEISRAQLWQWVTNGSRLADGREATVQLYRNIRDEEVSKLQLLRLARLDEAASLLDSLVLSEVFEEFLTEPAYRLLD